MRWPSLSVLLLFLLQPVARADVAPRWIVVADPTLEAALGPLESTRTKQGYQVVRSTLKDLPKARADAPPGSCVLLFGADVKAAEGTIGRMKGRPSDLAYGLVDGDRHPDLAVGRLPAKDLEQARAMVAKILRFEERGPTSAWRHRIVALVGHPGGSTAFERGFACRLVGGDIRKGFASIDPQWRVSALLHMPGSPYTVADDLLRSTALQRIQLGQLLTVFLGHSGPDVLVSTGRTFLHRDDWTHLNVPDGAGILLSCGCYTCQTRGRDGQGFGFAAVRNPNGPVAVIGAERASYGHMGKLAFEGLLPLLQSAQPPDRLGAWWLAMQRGLAEGPLSKLQFKLYDNADGSGGKVPLATQRLEHLEMWMLLGDPALRMPVQPPTVTLDIEPNGAVRPGSTLVIRGRLPDAQEGGRARVTLEPRFGRGAVVLATQDVAVAAGVFTAKFEVPSETPAGRHIVRAAVASPKGDRHGAAGLAIEPEAPSDESSR